MLNIITPTLYIIVVHVNFGQYGIFVKNKGEYI